MEHVICRCIVMFIYLVKNKTNTAKESMQAVLDAARHNDVEENAMSVFNHMFFFPPPE